MDVLTCPPGAGPSGLERSERARGPTSTRSQHREPVPAVDFDPPRPGPRGRVWHPKSEPTRVGSRSDFVSFGTEGGCHVRVRSVRRHGGEAHRRKAPRTNPMKKSKATHQPVTNLFQSSDVHHLQICWFSGTVTTVTGKNMFNTFSWDQGLLTALSLLLFCLLDTGVVWCFFVVPLSCTMLFLVLMCACQA